jgi:hypothetical protein
VADRGNRSIAANGDDDLKGGVVHFGRTENVRFGCHLPYPANRMNHAWWGL